MSAPNKKKEEMIKKMGHLPHHGARHLDKQMKYFASKKFSDKARDAADEASWKYARTNRLTDKLGGGQKKGQKGVINLN